MTCRVRLVLAIHNHQPIGNFDGVFESAYRDSYQPFLDVLAEYPEIPISLHNSGSLLEWLVDAHPEYIDRVRALVERGQVEILGGPFYEPILASIPRRDRVGQIALYARYLEDLFGTRVRGMWVPERVWEQTFAGDIARAGIEYTILDDHHFLGAGLRPEQLYSYYVTEDEGRLLKVFPGSERLRYTIPFMDPQATIDSLGQLADRSPNAVAVFGDDGEKFGTWPETKKHVYEDGWLRRFFDALRANSHWIRVTTLAEAVDNVPPAGTCYIPDSSYREMTEWALPSPRQLELRKFTKDKQSDASWGTVKPFLRGGFWRNFRVKYPEANEMYCRGLQVSERLETLWQSDAARTHRELLLEAQQELYRGQCNCSYWHGAFGGLYLPHLRNAVYRHLIAADNLLETAEGRSGRWVEAVADDFDHDARTEIRMAGDRLVAWLAPARGGHLYELDLRSIRHNLLATLNRRPEAYHEMILAAANQHDEQQGRDIKSIHDTLRFKQPGLDKQIAYDRWPRKSLVDHFLQPGLSLDEFRRGNGQIGDFATGIYEARLRRSDERVEAILFREGQLGPYRPRVTKTAALNTRGGSTLEIVYQLENLPREVPIHFAVEFNFAGMAAGADDRYYYDADGRQLGRLESVHELPRAQRIGLSDEWLGLDVSLDLSQPGDIWTFPIQTISQSEGGFELVHQSCAVVPRWQFVAPADGRWSVGLTLSMDTSAAHARQLREAAVAAR
jgi:alpha-amylase